MGIWARLDKTEETEHSATFRSVREFNKLGFYFILSGCVIGVMYVPSEWMLARLLSSPALFDRLIVYGMFSGMGLFMGAGLVFFGYRKKLRLDGRAGILSMKSRL